MELILSIVALAVGPLLFPLAKRQPRLLCGMDGFVLVSIAGLSLLHLMPVALDHAGPLALVTAFLGLLGPFLFGRGLSHAGQRNVHNIFILIAVAGLAFHAMIDGAALFHGTQHSAGHAGEHLELGAMVAAVLIHRVPMSLLVWWSLSPRMGKPIAAGALGVLAVATVTGFWVGGSFHITPELMGHLIALVAGSLVHVVAHDTSSEIIPRHCHDAWHATYSALGGAVAAAGLVAFGHIHEFEPAWQRFVALIVEGAPAILAGFALLVAAVRFGVPLLAGDDGTVAEPCGSHEVESPDQLGWFEWIDRVTPWFALALAIVFVLQAVAPKFALSVGESALAAEQHWWEWAAAAVLGIVLVVSYFRVGPRGMLAQLFPFEHDHGHGDHGHHD
ncbi:MAG: hypothetical protein ACLFVJ_18315 [Persicimonas sp.]